MLTLNTKIGSTANVSTLFITHVKSWEGMGTAELTCINNCNCAPVTMDSLWTSKSTQTALFPFQVNVGVST